MTGFNAKDALDPFDYDLRPYADEKGTIPEPSDAAALDFYEGLTDALESALGAERLEGVNLRDADERAQLMSELSREDMEKMQGVMLDLHAGVCNGHPTREGLEALPYRLKQAFYGALQGWLSPEGSTPVTKR